MEMIINIVNQVLIIIIKPVMQNIIIKKCQICLVSQNDNKKDEGY